MLSQALAAQKDHACPVDAISRAYLGFAGGDAGIALRCAIADALSDLMDAERRTRERSRLISRGYVREAPMITAEAES
ncbi:hypothetical protein JHFBIEKO_2072 [Methylobacterium mesophilicum]|jgi:hypothetical protein|uniref:hypothetical protein n=1 Tax=Methylobacterium TaxID=407 RepID=UPI0011CA1D50|nr:MULTISPECIES: hypothetical protein [Methylobacterium]TXN45586.1 hypothetical protein FV233_10965 [Methylobacterium sp. WL7]TXN69380.1 hypothetical protein FV228_12775 [Methylobacterium sp. WL18]GJE21628.1 hypothetical protein JHFBIEKO_2072 [Methylobacterium mesophilicum]